MEILAECPNRATAPPQKERSRATWNSPSGRCSRYVVGTQDPGEGVPCPMIELRA